MNWEIIIGTFNIIEDGDRPSSNDGSSVTYEYSD